MVSQGDVVLVTGGAGFIGSNVVHALAADGVRVVVSDRFGTDDRWTNLASAALDDVIEPDALGAWLVTRSDRLAAVVHMGAISATTERDVDAIVRNNIRLSLDLWQLCCERQIPFVYASSAATYGDGRHGFVDDDSEAGLARLAPLNPYGWSKHLVDRRIARDVAEGRRVPACWAGLKFFNVYGPREGHKGSMRSVVHQIWPRAASGQTVALFRSDHPDYEDGGQRRDFIHVDDCVSVIRAALRKPSLGGIYNVGTGEARTFRDLARATFAAVGREPQIAYVEMPDTLKGRYQYFTEADTTRLRAAGLAPNFKSMEERITEYVEWLENNSYT